MFNKLLAWVCNWAMGVKNGEDGAKVGIYYVQDWE
jgi:hypothetical protein